MAYNVLIVEDQSMPRQLFEIFVNSSNECLFSVNHLPKSKSRFNINGCFYRTRK